MPFQTQNEIRETLHQAGMRPQHRHGQHFLVDRNLMQKLVDSAEIAPDDVVLEIGPGTGSLTNMLAELAAHVVTVEIDTQIAEVARRHLAHHDNVTLLVTDALKGKNHLNPQVIETLLDKHRHRRGPMPAGREPALQRRLADRRGPAAGGAAGADAVLHRAEGGGRSHGRRAADQRLRPAVGCAAGPRECQASRPRAAARPSGPPLMSSPRSSRSNPTPDRKAAAGDPHHLAAVVHRLFLHRRKTLWQNLKLAYDDRADALKDDRRDRLAPAAGGTGRRGLDPPGEGPAAPPR